MLTTNSHQLQLIRNRLHFADFGKVGERGFLGANSYDLRRFHNEAFLLASDHVGILLSHYVKHTLQQLTQTYATSHEHSTPSSIDYFVNSQRIFEIILLTDTAENLR